MDPQKNAFRMEIGTTFHAFNFLTFQTAKSLQIPSFAWAFMKFKEGL